MTGTDDRDPRIAELLERHTPEQEGSTDWARVTGRRRRRRIARPVTAATGVAIAVVALIAGIVAAPGGRDGGHGAAALTYGRQADVGVALRLRVTPRTGQPVEDAARSAAAALDARAKAQGFTVLTDPHRDGTLDMWVPVARSSGQLSELLQPADAALFDRGAGRVAEGSELPAVLTAGEALAPRGPGATLYVVDRTGNPIQGPAPDVAGLRRMLGGTGPIPKAFIVRYVPAGYTLIADLRWRRFAVQRDTPLVSGPDIASVARVPGSPTDVALTLTPAGRARWGDAARSGAPVDLVLYQEVGPPTVYATVDAARSTATRLVATTAGGRYAEFVSRFVPGGTLPRRPEVIAEQPTGPAPTATTDATAGIPPTIEGWLRDGVFGGSRTIVRDSLRRMVAVTNADGEWSIWLARDSEGDVIEMVVDPRIGGGTQGGGSGAPCPLTPAHPLVRICGTGPGHTYGRVSERVVRISGADRTAVGNGWFLAVDDGAAMNAPPPGTITGYDAGGLPVATASGIN